MSEKTERDTPAKIMLALFVETADAYLEGFAQEIEKEVLKGVTLGLTPFDGDKLGTTFRFWTGSSAVEDCEISRTLTELIEEEFAIWEDDEFREKGLDKRLQNFIKELDAAAARARLALERELRKPDLPPQESES
jgi:hypothetical protein